ncbi:glutathione S-transferase family protein [Phenylobacterium sp.]|jgi:glutathione S-transferase|uniref:glutathione S-transferase family protein n=1 Tax=Phenylobacterium sp. TaxID=1871053 RepID=UPI002E32765A|nr:glutathione S-transferase family protein [Phenylobacterium sp.]HEX2559467.1 glutathione S-transferase family protein [Phenylobacterium sp.]
MSLVLHLHPLSSYCWKVLIGLYELGAPFEPRMVNLGDADARAAFAALWPTGKIPLLEDVAAGRVIPETSIMLEYVDARSAGPAQLLPEAVSARLDARLWDRLFDNYVMTPMQKIVADRLRPEGAKDPQGVKEARAMLAMAYGMIDARMAGRDWPAGEAFSLADCAAAPALFYASIVEPIPAGLPHLPAYFERLLARPSVARAIDEARPWFQYYPYREDMPARFLEPAEVRA